MADEPSSASAPEEELVMKTFVEWKDSGFRIMKGEKATRIDGVCKFSQHQVKRNTPTPLSDAIDESALNDGDISY